MESPAFKGTSPQLSPAAPHPAWGSGGTPAPPRGDREIMGSGKAFRGHQDYPLLERQGPQDHRELMGRGGTRSPPSPCSPLPEVLQEHFPGAHVPPRALFKRSFPVQSRRPVWAATPGLPASSLGSKGPVGQRGRGLCSDPKTSPGAQEPPGPCGAAQGGRTQLCPPWQSVQRVWEAPGSPPPAPSPHPPACPPREV